MSKETKALVIHNPVDDVELKTKPPVTREQTLELMAKALADEEQKRYAQMLAEYQKIQNEYQALVTKETEEVKRRLMNNISSANISVKFEYGVFTVYASQGYSQSSELQAKHKELQTSRLSTQSVKSYNQILQKLQFADEHQHFEVLKNEDAKKALMEAGKELLGRTSDSNAIDCEEVDDQ